MKIVDWSQIAEEQVGPLASRQIIYTDAMTIVRRQLSKGAVTSLHGHIEEQLCIVESGQIRYIIQGEAQVALSGDILSIPSNVPHSLEALETSLVIDIFSLPPVT